MMLRQIQHFQTVIQENSFTEAAELCHISQSGISQSIKALEDEIGVKLLIRKNRSFELTEAGEHFYKKSLILTADLEQLCRETVRIDRKDAAELSLGVLSTYSGDEFNRAIAAFSEKYPTVELKVTSGNHEDLYDGLRFGRIDLALNDQRRAFSDAYENLILTETVCYVEMASHNPLAKLLNVSVDELKNTPCILVASKEQQEEQRFYHDIIGFSGRISLCRVTAGGTSHGGFKPRHYASGGAKQRYLFRSNDKASPAPSRRVADYKKVLRLLEEGQFRLLYRGFCRDTEVDVLISHYSHLSESL